MSGPSGSRGPFGAFSATLLQSLLSEVDSDSEYDFEIDLDRLGTGMWKYGIDTHSCASISVDWKNREFSVSPEVIDGKDCEMHVTVDLGSAGACLNWMSTIFVFCKLNDKELGHAVARYIKRDEIRDRFWDVMRASRSIFRDFPEVLFDRFGRLQEQHKTHPIRRGTGVWGPEVDTGSILLIDHFDFNTADWRGKGMGKLFMKYIRQTAYQSTVHHASSRPQHKVASGTSYIASAPLNPTLEIVCPGIRQSTRESMGKTESEMEQFHKDNEKCSTQFIRSHGFRRIGLSSWFAYTNDNNHPSHALAASADSDVKAYIAPSEETDAQRENRMARMRRQSPLLYAILNSSDQECVSLFKTKFPKSSVHWRSSDENSCNLLHEAAMMQMPRSVYWIMQNIDPVLHLSSGLNVHCHTPLDLVHGLWDERLRSGWSTDTEQLMHDTFAGYEDRQIQVLAALQGFDPMVASQVRRFKFGCTCLVCVGGILSQQSCVSLIAHATNIAEILLTETDNGKTWLEKHEQVQKHIPTKLFAQMLADSDLRKGFAAVLTHISKCIERKALPTPNAVRGHVNSDKSIVQSVKVRLRVVGLVEGILRTLFKVAKMECALAGNGHGLQLYGDKVSGLKYCRNDGEWSCAALACGIKDL